MFTRVVNLLTFKGLLSRVRRGKGRRRNQPRPQRQASPISATIQSNPDQSRLKKRLEWETIRTQPELSEVRSFFAHQPSTLPAIQPTRAISSHLELTRPISTYLEFAFFCHHPQAINQQRTFNLQPSTFNPPESTLHASIPYGRRR